MSNIANAAETAAPRQLGVRAFRLGVGACTLAVAVFLVVQLNAWPPHEDEALVLFTGRHSLGDLLGIVLGRRGGAPLHFMLAWVVVHTGGGLIGLRLMSAIFDVASLPVLGLLVARLAGRTVGLVSVALASTSWVLLFHGVYGRMYSLFLFTSALSYLALLAALERGGRWRWLLWGLAMLATVATHPYGALVLGSQGLYVLLRRARLRQAVPAFVLLTVAATPFWRTDLVLAGRFDVGVGGGGAKLGGPVSVLRYLWQVAGDFSAGFRPVVWIVIALLALGAWLLARRRAQGALLTLCVFVTPTLAFLLVSLGNSTSPESRHLIFALPFFSMLVATALVELPRLGGGRRRLVLAPLVAAAGLAALDSAEVAWAWHKTPPLFTGEPSIRVVARHEASAWLARTSRQDDILFGYDPLFLGAWERGGRVSATVVPRADPTLALEVLRGAAKHRPLGRGVWVFDASDTNNFDRRLYIPLRLPQPAAAFDARVFGPFLVIRSKEPTRTPMEYLDESREVMAVGESLYIGDADIDLHTVEVAEGTLQRADPRSLSTSSR